jgi:ribose transport system substrate-binding protein
MPHLSWLPGRAAKIGAIAAASAAFAVVGCGSSDESSATGTSEAATAAATTASDKPVRIAFFSGAFGNSWYKGYLEGVEKTAKADNATVEAFDANFDAQKQYTQMQDAITSGDFDAFAVTALDGPALAPLIEQAKEKGIPVVGLGTALGTDYVTPDPQVDGVVGVVTAPAATDGKNNVALIEQACEGKDPCEVAYILGLKSYGYDTARLKAIQDGLKSSPNIKIVAVVEGGFLADPAFKVTQDLLQAHKDLDVIATSGDQMTNGAEKAVDDAGRSEEIVLLGAGASQIAYDAIKEGRWAGSTVHMPRAGGEVGGQMMIDAVRGKPIEKAGINEPVDLSPIGPFLSKDNMDEFEPQWAG